MALRRGAALGAVLIASAGLAGCRGVPEGVADDGDRTQQAAQSVPASPPTAQAAPEAPAEPVSSTSAGEASAEPTSPADAEGTSPSGTEAPVDESTPPGVAELEAAAAADERKAAERSEQAAEDASEAEAEAGAEGDADGDSGSVLGTTAESEAPKPVDPWRLVGQPYLVDDESPEAAPDGTTSFTLWFRTRGDFRGVRAGTSVTDDRHFKVGFITIPELPAYVPGGVGMLQRSERMLQKGRYCWTAEVHLQGQRGNKRFVLRRDGAPLQVQFDLRGAPIQRRTATVLVRNTTASNPAPTPVERALACR